MPNGVVLFWKRTRPALGAEEVMLESVPEIDRANSGFIAFDDTKSHKTDSATSFL